MGSWILRLRGRSLAVRAGWLGLVTVGLYALLAPVAGVWTGSAGLWAAAVAGVLCFAGAGLALAASSVLRGPKYALHAMLAGMAARMGIPLVIGTGLHLHGGVLAEGGLVYCLLVFYPVTLAVETVLSLPPTEQTRRWSKASQDDMV